MEPIKPALRTTHEFVSLRMQELPDTAELQTIANGPPDYRQRWAARMLKRTTKPTGPEEYPYPVTAWKLGTDQIWITLGGEVVVDYSLRLKSEFGERTWTTAYSNDVMAYIPSLRVLREGGYEGQSSMMIYGLPTERWSEEIEERIVATVGKCVRRIQADQ
jgi:neutral ceramidase